MLAEDDFFEYVYDTLGVGGHNSSSTVLEDANFGDLHEFHHGAFPVLSIMAATNYRLQGIITQGLVPQPLLL